MWTVRELTEFSGGLHSADALVLLDWMTLQGQAVRMRPSAPASAALSLRDPPMFAVGAPPSLSPLSYERALLRWTIAECRQQATGRQAQAERSVMRCPPIVRMVAGPSHSSPRGCARPLRPSSLRLQTASRRSRGAASASNAARQSCTATETTSLPPHVHVRRFQVAVSAARVSDAERPLHLLLLCSPIGSLNAAASLLSHADQLLALMEALETAREQQRVAEVMQLSQRALTAFQRDQTLSAEDVEDTRQQWEELLEGQRDIDRALAADVTEGLDGVTAREVEDEFREMERELQQEEGEDGPATSPTHTLSVPAQVHGASSGSRASPLAVPDEISPLRAQPTDSSPQQPSATPRHAHDSVVSVLHSF